MDSKENNNRNASITNNRLSTVFGSIITLLIILIITILFYHTFNSLLKVVYQVQQLKELQGRISLNDEKLTMSANMFSYSGESKWQQRYIHVEPELDLAIKEAILLAPNAKVGFQQVDKANVALVAMENEVFDFVRQGNLIAARDILSSQKYTEEKEAYAAGLDKAMIAIRNRMHDEITTAKIQLGTATLLSTIFLIFIVSMWYAIHRKLGEQYMLNFQAAQTADKARRAAESEVEFKNRFLAKMSHEIRTPMNGVISAIELLQETLLEEEQLRLATCIHNSGRILLAIINQVLDISKIEAGRMVLYPEDCCLTQVISETLNIVDYKALEKNLYIDFRVDENVPKFIKLDILRFQQIILNLVGNAIKFTEQGKVSITVSSTLISERKDEVMLSIAVKDTGIGIPEDRLGSIFSEFVQADNSTTRQYGGTGLGLPIARYLVELMHGEITVNSKEGIGSEFIINLPVKIVESKSPVIQEKEIDVRILKHARILVVEDNQVNQLVVKTLLQRQGCIVEVAKDGSEAIALVEKNTYDLLLMDCEMPIMDGYTAATFIRYNEKQGNHIPIIAMTANVMPGDREKCLNAGMDEYLVKPVSRHLLFSVMVKYLMLATARQA